MKVLAFAFYKLLRPCCVRGLRHSYSTQSGTGSGMSPGIMKHLESVKERHRKIMEQLSSEHVDVKQELFKEQSVLEPIVNLMNQIDRKKEEINDYEIMIEDEEHVELIELAKNDRLDCVQQLKELELTLINALVLQDDADSGNVVIEVRSGAGGREASLFTSEVFLMYNRFSDFKGWKFDMLSCDKNEDGGYKNASASVTGNNAYGELKYEAGVHRVQRVPSTEGLGRVHTSTTTVAILPEPTEVDMSIHPGDIKIDTFRAGGAGGQHVNTTDSAVRITHIPTGTTVRIQDERSQHQNRVKAMKVLRARLYDIKRTKKDEERTRERKQQIGTGGREERIRTYNYNQDRVTDHRVGVSLHGVQEFLQGNHLLQNLIDKLKHQQRTNYLTKTFN